MPAAEPDLARALVIAAGEGRVEATALLLDVGAPIDARGELGGTALHHAAWRGRGGTVDLLLRRGADPLALAPEPASGTPLAWAAHGSRHAAQHGDAYLGIGKRLVSAGDVRDVALADGAAGALADWLAGRDELAPAPSPRPGDVDYGELSWQLDVENLRLIARVPGVDVRELDDGFAVRTGVDDNTLNGVVCDEHGDVADVLAWLEGSSAQWHVGAQAGLHARLVEAGARPERSAVVMGASSGALELMTGSHDIRPVANEGELDAWLGVGEESGFVDGPQARAAYRRILGALALARELPLRLHVAWSGGLAIGAISARRHADAVAIDHLDVRHGARRSGVGRALVSAALAAETGWAHVVLGPTPSSVAFYERLGFVLQRYPADRSYYLPARPTA